MKRKHFHVTVGLVLKSAQTLFTVKRRVCSFLFPLRLLCCLCSQICTQTVFSLDHLCPCVLCFLSEAEKKARLTSKTGSQQSVKPPSQVYEPQWNISKPRSATVIPLNTHSFKSCANERLIVRTTRCGRPLWTRAGRLYIGLWQAHHLTSFFLISRRERKLSTQIFFPLPVVLSSSPFILPVCSRLLSFHISEGRSLGSSLIVWVSREEIGRA